MTNLIPQRAKKQIVVEYWVRMFSSWVIIWSIGLVVSSIVLWPTYVLIVGSNAAYSESVVDATERTETYNTISENLTRANRQAQSVIVMDSQPVLSEVWQVIKQQIGQGVTIESFTISRTESGLAAIAITGEASNRQSLAEFRDNIETIDFVAAVDLPIENLAKNQDIEFNLSVEVNNDAL